MILEDFVFLGTTVPEQMKDGRVVRCSAGFSTERRSLVRVYPISPYAGVHRWDQYRINLEVNPKDSRAESYKLKGDRSDPDALTARLVEEGKVGHIQRPDRLAAIDKFKVPSIAYMNDRRMSLGIIKPDLHDYSFEYDEVADEAVQTFPGMEVDRVEWGRRSFPRRPRIQFSDSDGRHDLSLNEHGVYEWIRKGNPPEGAFTNLHFGASDYDVRLLVGNLCNQRNAWVVIAYIGLKKMAPSLFDEAVAS